MSRAATRRDLEIRRAVARGIDEGLAFAARQRLTKRADVISVTVHEVRAALALAGWNITRKPRAVEEVRR